MKIEDANITLNVFDDILNGMSKEQKLELARLICWDDDILSDFVGRLMTDYASESMDSHIHRARLQMIDLMPQAAVEVIRALTAEVQRAKASADEYRSWAFDLYHAWPHYNANGEYVRCPEMPKYQTVSTPHSDEIMRKCGYVPVELKDEELTGI